LVDQAPGEPAALVVVPTVESGSGFVGAGGRLLNWRRRGFLRWAGHGCLKAIHVRGRGIELGEHFRHIRLLHRLRT
jgi:hypothetical protein